MVIYVTGISSSTKICTVYYCMCKPVYLCVEQSSHFAKFGFYKLMVIFIEDLWK